MDNAVKYKIVEKIIQSEDEIILNDIKALLGISEGDFWPELPNEVQGAINEAKSELDRGEGIPHENVMEEMRKRFLK
jgi:hypothetical protein